MIKEITLTKHLKNKNISYSYQDYKGESRVVIELEKVRIVCTCFIESVDLLYYPTKKVIDNALKVGLQLNNVSEKIESVTYEKILIDRKREVKTDKLDIDINGRIVLQMETFNDGKISLLKIN